MPKRDSNKPTTTGTDKRPNKLSQNSFERRSSIGKTLRSYESDLHKKLSRLYDNHIVHDINSYSPPENIERKYQAVVRMRIRNAVTKSYFHGIDIVRKHIQRHVPEFDVFPTSTDIQNMTRGAVRAEGHYWYNIAKLFDNAHRIDPDGSPHNRYSSKASMQEVAIKTVYASFSSAVASKYPNALGLLALPHSVNNSTRAAASSTLGTLTDLLGITMTLIKLEWTTAGDTKVCNTGELPYDCQSQEGKKWLPQDPDIPEMPAHNFCRCFWTPVEDRSIDWGQLLTMLALGILTEEEIRRGAE